MPIKDFVGGVIADVDADDLNRYLIQSHHVIKPSNESVSNSTSFQNDDHLMVQVEANTNYWVVCQLLYTGATTGDLRMGYSAPSGSIFAWMTDAIAAGATSTTDIISRTMQTLDSVDAIAGSVGGSDSVAIGKGILRVGNVGGTFRFRFAQGTSNATSTTVLAGSILMIRRLIN